jgi:large subunit ribosomal protein L18
MSAVAKIARIFARRKFRVRKSVKENGSKRLRLSVFRSNIHIYAQIIDDELGRTVASATSSDSILKMRLPDKPTKCEMAYQVGRLLAERAISVGLSRQVAFDRGGYIFHGRVRSLAQGAREAGLDF